MTAENVPSFEEMLADPNEQFDRRGELLKSITEYANAPQCAAPGGRPPAAVEPLSAALQAEVARRVAEARADEWRLLRAVIHEIHFQYRSVPDYDTCAGCNQASGGWVPWPCPTWKAIEARGEALKAASGPSGDDATWMPVNWPSTDYRGEALDLAVKAGGVFSMRRHGDLVSVAAVPSGTTLALALDEVLAIATSLLAAYRLSTESEARTDHDTEGDPR